MKLRDRAMPCRFEGSARAEARARIETDRPAKGAAPAPCSARAEARARIETLRKDVSAMPYGVAPAPRRGRGLKQQTYKTDKAL